MKHMKISQFYIVVCVALIPFLSRHSLLGQESKIEKSMPLEVVHIYSDENGESHFGKTELPFNLINYAPPSPPISVSEVFASEGVVIISSPVGWNGDWHPSPRKQLMFCLIGKLEVTVSDGESRRFGPGSIILVEDTSGKGHVSKVVGNERCFMAAVQLVNSVE